MGNFRDTNFFKKEYVQSTEFDVMVKWNFISQGIAISAESDNINDVIQYSFDGSTVHGDCTPTMVSEGLMFDNRSQCAVWLRRATAGDPVLVRIEAWKN